MIHHCKLQKNLFLQVSTFLSLQMQQFKVFSYMYFYKVPKQLDLNSLYYIKILMDSIFRYNVCIRPEIGMCCIRYQV